VRLGAGERGDALHEIEHALRRAAFSSRTTAITFAVSALLNPRLRKKASRSSSLRATIRSRAALIPVMKGAGEEMAKLVKAGAASWAKRCAANLLCRMMISSNPSTPQRLRFMQTAMVVMPGAPVCRASDEMTAWSTLSHSRRRKDFSCESTMVCRARPHSFLISITVNWRRKLSRLLNGSSRTIIVSSSFGSAFTFARKSASASWICRRRSACCGSSVCRVRRPRCAATPRLP